MDFAYLTVSHKLLHAPTSHSNRLLALVSVLVSVALIQISYLTVWGVKPVVIHQTSWLESTGRTCSDIGPSGTGLQTACCLGMQGGQDP